MKKFFHVSAIIGLLATAVGCSNYTVAPVCDESNATVPSGLTGSYTLSAQNEDYSVTTKEFEIRANEAGHLTLRSQDGEDEAAICSVGGQIIQETHDSNVQGYEQERIYVTGMGITILPVFYDKVALDRDGVPNKVFTLPETVSGVLGKRLSASFEAAASRVAAFFADGATGLMVDNSGIAANKLMSYGAAGPVGFTLLRR